MIDFTKAIEMIRQGENILVTSHVRPDGDALGSLMGTRLMIEGLAKKENRSCKVTTLVLSNPSELYEFLLPEDVWQVDQQANPEDIDSAQLDEFDLIIVVDTSATRQLPGVGEYIQKKAKNVLVIDHHVSGDIEGHEHCVDTTAAAAGELITELFLQANVEICETAAKALFTAIVTDTGWFRFESCTPKTIKYSADLAEAGACPSELYQHLYQNDPPERLHLMIRVLETLELHCDNRLAIMQISNDMLKETGAKRSHIENMVNIPQQISTVLAVALIVEQDNGSCRCSFRSKNSMDVNKVANQFNGGGHIHAAGASLDQPLADSVKAVTTALQAAILQLH